METVTNNILKFVGTNSRMELQLHQTSKCQNNGIMHETKRRLCQKGVVVSLSSTNKSDNS